VQRLLPLVKEYPELAIVHACFAFVLSCKGAQDEAIERGRQAVLISPGRLRKPALFRPKTPPKLLIPHRASKSKWPFSTAC
jgi:hypothetical protein